TGSGKEVILIMGSCRVAPYINYLDLWNRTIGENRFTIHSVDPFNWNWLADGSWTDIKAAINACETDKRILDMLASVDIFLHEYYRNFGMFNIFKGDGEKNIYDYGMKPKIDVMIPSFNDIFILFNDFYVLDKDVKSSVDYDYKSVDGLMPSTKAYIQEKGLSNFDKFCEICLKSDLPEMRDYIVSELKNKRFFWNFNHVSKHFTLAAMMLINGKFLKLNMPQEYLDEISKTDMFENPHTPLCEYDVEIYGFNWGEQVVNFKEYNKIGV
ncbi:MAG TPA: hypothetical protein VK590_01825, partial [Saprospiraceae bacterium]|nr:hypothetical protein [Saprospiraceae bacterium]